MDPELKRALMPSKAFEWRVLRLYETWLELAGWKKKEVSD